MRRQYLRKIQISFIFTIFCLSTFGAEWHVDYNSGNNRNDGSREKPFRNFATALEKALPGDTIRLLPSDRPIADSLIVRNRRGEPGKPITVDGMMNVITGSVSINPAQWTEMEPGLFHRRRKVVATMIPRYFMVADGRISRMGRFTKGVGAARFKRPQELKGGEWTAVNSDPADKGKNRWVDFYFRLPEGVADPAAAKLAEPRSFNGVAISGECSDLTFRNLIVMHAWNDGFNIHGNSRNIRFENIAALECGDDGISAHETSQIRVANFVSIGNSTGVCHIQSAESDHENVYIGGIAGRDISMFNDTVNSFRRLYIDGSSSAGVSFANTAGSVTLSDCRVVNSAPGGVLFFADSPEFLVSISDFQAAGYTALPRIDGVTSAPVETVRAETEKARRELFKLFGGKIETLLEMPTE